MKQKYKILMLASDNENYSLVKVARILFTKGTGIWTGDSPKFNLYITSDEPIKEGDWMYDEHPERGLAQIRKCPSSSYHGGGYWKIIATTDKLNTFVFNHLNEKVFPVNVYLPKLPQSLINTFIDRYNKSDIMNYVELELTSCELDYETNWNIAVNKNNEVIVVEDRVYSREELYWACIKCIELYEYENKIIDTKRIKKPSEIVDNWLLKNL